MFRSTCLQVLAALLALSAAYVSYNLLVKHVTGSSGVSWFEEACNPDTGETVSLPLSEESDGSQRLLALAGPLWSALQKGHTLVVDELDCSMHPLLVRKLIEYFQSERHNTAGAQLIFTTHDSTLLDLSLFRRDQINLVEKDQVGGSDLFTLYDFEAKPRRDEAIHRGYLAGRYGAIPVFGPMLEDL